ncbi:MAG: hypothetical protein K2X74_03090 [Acetobacteraceae bacterium]|nr:hypothetical protein [Acetobacteraceae bacterium]
MPDIRAGATRAPSTVMAGLDPAFPTLADAEGAGMPGSWPDMTIEEAARPTAQLCRQEESAP